MLMAGKDIGRDGGGGGGERTSRTERLRERAQRRGARERVRWRLASDRPKADALRSLVPHSEFEAGPGMARCGRKLDVARYAL